MDDDEKGGERSPMLATCGSLTTHALVGDGSRGRVSAFNWDDDFSPLTF